MEKHGIVRVASRVNAMPGNNSVEISTTSQIELNMGRRYHFHDIDHVVGGGVSRVEGRTAD
jgi:hypothetical protein